jgi:hypothetical protein
MVLALICYGRINYRVEYSIFTSAAMVLGYYAGKTHIYRDNHLSAGVKYLLLCFTAAIFVAWHSIVYLPDNSYKTLDQEHYFGYVWNTMQNSGGYNPNKYNIRISSRRPCEKLLSVIENDKDNYYLYRNFKDANVFGMIASIHTFGRDLKWNPHIHALVPELIYDPAKDEIRHFHHFDFKNLRLTWQYELNRLMSDYFKDSFTLLRSEFNRFLKLISINSKQLSFDYP